MASIRQQKFARLIQREMSEILAHQVEEFKGLMVSLTHVTSTPDLGLVRCYLTVFPEDQLAEVLAFLTHGNHDIRRRLGARIRNSVRIVPEIEFYEDDTLKTANRLEALFAKIRAEEAEKPHPHLPPE